jgi:hypothetical protein
MRHGLAENSAGHGVLTTNGHLFPDAEDRSRRAVDQAWRAPHVPQEQAQ